MSSRLVKVLLMKPRVGYNDGIIVDMYYYEISQKVSVTKQYNCQTLGMTYDIDGIPNFCKGERLGEEKLLAITPIRPSDQDCWNKSTGRCV